MTEKYCRRKKRRRENEGNQRLTYTQHKTCILINFLISATTSYKVIVVILSLISCFFCVHINSPGHRDPAFPRSSEEFYCQKEFESLLYIITYLSLFLPQTNFNRPSTLTGMLFFHHQSDIEIPMVSIFWLGVTFICATNKDSWNFHYILIPHLWIQYYNNSFLSFNQWIFVEHLLCASCYAGGYYKSKESNFCLSSQSLGLWFYDHDCHFYHSLVGVGTRTHIPFGSFPKNL